MIWLISALKWSAIVAAVQSLIYLAIRWIHEMRGNIVLKRGNTYKLVTIDRKEKRATKAAILKAVEATAFMCLLLVVTL